MDSKWKWLARAARAGGLAAVVAVGACGDEPVVPTNSIAGSAGPGVRSADAYQAQQKVFICHKSAVGGTIIEVAGPAVASHQAHGDYVTTLHVDREGGGADDGIHYRRIGDALDAARAGRIARGELLSAACRITITISPGMYPGSTALSTDDEQFPLVVDVPDITLRGALVMQQDANGRADGAAPGSGETVLMPTVPLPIVGGVSTPLMIANGHPGGSAGHGFTVEGLVLQSGHSGIGSDVGGQAILTLRVEGILVRGNQLGGGFTEAIDLRASNAEVVLNLLAGPRGSCDICLAGPGSYRASDNKLFVGGIPGITISGMVGLPVPAGIEPLVLTPTAETWAEVRNNEVRDHLRIPVGAGLRVEAQGIAAPGVHNTIHTIMQDNLLINNRFGILVHGGFTGAVGAASELSSDVDVTLGGNTFIGNCQAKLLITLARHQRTLGLSAFPSLVNSNFRLMLGGDLNWDEAWFGHEAGFGNTLMVDGEVIANGVRHFYSAAGCPGL